MKIKILGIVMKSISCIFIKGLIYTLMFWGVGSAHAQKMGYEGITDYGFDWTFNWVDINNDGRDDFCSLAGGSGENLNCWIASGDTFIPQPTINVGPTKSRFNILMRWVDINADGSVDICVQAPVQTVICRYGPAFSSAMQNQVDLPYIIVGGQGLDGTDSTIVGFTGEWWFADVNGDGFSDLCYATKDVPNEVGYSIACQLNQGGLSWAAATSEWKISGYGRAAADGQTFPHGMFDFDGDGLQDYCELNVQAAPPKLVCRLAGPAGFSSTEISRTIDRGSVDGAAFVDINADGNIDYCRFIGGAGTWKLSCVISTGASWAGTELTSPIMLENHGDLGKRLWGDVNGDGFPDYCRYSSGVNLFLCRLSRGDGPNNIAFGYSDVSIAVSEAGIGAFSMCNASGVGYQTYCRLHSTTLPPSEQCWEGENGVTCVTTVPSLGGMRTGVTEAMQASAGFIDAVDNGLGATTRITYLPLTSSHVYRRASPSVAPHAIVLQPPASVVAETRAWKTGSQEALTGSARYFYGDLRRSRDAGSLGFRDRWIFTEGSNSLEHVRYFQGLGSGSDLAAGSINLAISARGRLELGEVFLKERFTVVQDMVTSDSIFASVHQNAISGVIAKAMRATIGAAKPTVDSPFVLLERTTSTLKETVAEMNPRFRYAGKSVTERFDFDGEKSVPLPTTTVESDMSKLGNLTRLVQTTTHGNLTWSKTTSNTYFDDTDTAWASKWMLGRLKDATVVSEAPSPTAQQQSAASESVATLLSGSLAFTNPLVPGEYIDLSALPQVRVLEFRNDGGSPMTISGIDIRKATGFEAVSAPFSITNNSCSNVVAGGKCSITVTASRSLADVSFEGLTRGAAVNAAVQVSLRSHGSIATLTPASPTLSFGTAGQGTTVPAKAWTFRNDGDTPMSLTLNPALASTFQLSTNNCIAVAPGATCTSTVTMSTSTLGNFNQTGLSMIGASGGAVGGLAVSGTVVAAVVNATPTSLAFGTINASTFKTLVLTITNPGNAPVGNLTFASSNSFFSTTAGGTCPGPGGSLAALAQCTQSITFRPDCTISSKSGTLTVSGNGVTPLSIPMTGAGRNDAPCLR